jgi:nucleotide-binding universal stress UspA family protein
MFTRVLVPLDGSTPAEHVLPYARLLAAKLHIAVELLSVVETPVHMAARKALYLEDLIERAVTTSDEYLKRVAATFANTDIRTTVRKGNPEELILATAEADASILIAMASHGYSGITRWLLGSIAEKVMRESKNPVLLVRGREDAVSPGVATLTSIIVPLDGSELAATILPKATELAQFLTSKLVILQSFSGTQGFTSYEAYRPDFDELEQSARRAATDYLAEKKEQLMAAGVEVLTVAAEGDPAETIIELAKGSPQSLIAMSTHGRSGIRRWLLGSVTEKVARHADDPLLVIRAQ